MAIKRSIFAPEPGAEAKAKTEFEDPAFTFRSGTQVDGKPKSLSEWRIQTDDQRIASAVAELLGGTPKSGPKGLLVDTSASSVDIVIGGSRAIKSSMLKWGSPGQPPIHECDGDTFLSGSRKGKPCGCPTTLQERKDAAKEGWGPSPFIKVDFRLAQDYELGLGRYNGTSWVFAEALYEVLNDLDEVDGDALCTLTLEKVEFTSDKYGLVAYTKPVIKVLGSYNAAIAEEPPF